MFGSFLVTIGQSVAALARIVGPMLGVPLFWPMTAALQMAEQGLEVYGKNLEFLAEEEKIQHELGPALATANRVVLDLRTMLFRGYGAPDAKGGYPSDSINGRVEARLAGFAEAARRFAQQGRDRGDEGPAAH